MTQDNDKALCRVCHQVIPTFLDDTAERRRRFKTHDELEPRPGTEVRRQCEGTYALVKGTE